MDIPRGAPLPDLGDAYELKGRLGSGAMGAVYRAHDRRLARDVAVKLLSDELDHNPEVRARFLREARALALCNHPNIIQVHGCSDPDAGVQYLITELVDGPTLAEWLEDRSALPWPVALALAVELLRGLALAHRRGIVHRDIKPSNVLIDAEGVPKLADFGIARVAGSTTLTGANALVGTVRYMAPEAFEGVAPTPGQDVYAMGCLLYELISGRPAFAHQNAAELMHMICEGLHGSLERVTPGTPAAVSALVDRALDREVSARFPSADAFAEACRDLLAPEGVTDTARFVAAHVTADSVAHVSGKVAGPGTVADSPMQRSQGLVARLRSALRAMFWAQTIPEGFRPAAGPGTRVDAATQKVLWAAHFGDALRLVHGLALLTVSFAIAATFAGPQLADALGIRTLVVAGLAHGLVFLATGVAGPTPAARRIALGASLSGVFLALASAGDLLMLGELLPDRWPAELAVIVVFTLGAVVLVTLGAELAGAFGAAGRRAVWGTALALIGLVVLVDVGSGLAFERTLFQSALPLVPAATPVATAVHSGAVLATPVALWAASPGLAPLRMATESTPDPALAPELAALPQALSVAAADAMSYAVGTALPKTDLTAPFGTRDQADLARIGKPVGGTVLLEAPAAVAEGTAARFVAAHTALTLALARRTGARWVALPAVSATLFLRATRRATETELVNLLEQEALVLKRELPGVSVGFAEAVPMADSSLADAMADRAWVDWIALAPFPGTFPIKELEQARKRLGTRNAAGKLALISSAPLVPSAYRPWHEAEHAALVMLAARYARSLGFRLWVHLPVRSFESYGLVRRRGMLRPTASLDAFRVASRP